MPLLLPLSLQSSPPPLQQNSTHSKTLATTNAQNILILQTFTSFSDSFSSWKWVLYCSTVRRTGEQECVMQRRTFWIEVDVTIHELITTLNGFISMVCVSLSLSSSWRLECCERKLYLPCRWCSLNTVKQSIDTFAFISRVCVRSAICRLKLLQ